jgi:hypothetical protein
MTKLNIFGIIFAHFGTFVHQRTRVKSISDFVIFLGFPLFIGIIAFRTQLTVSENAICILVTSLSIFAALLFNLLLLTYDIIKRKNGGIEEQKSRFLKEIYANISFAILNSLFAVIALLLLLFVQKDVFWQKVIISSSAFLIALFLLTMLMILKRIYSLLGKEFEDSEGGKND